MNSAPKKYYSVKEAANLIGVSTNTIYAYLKEGSLAARRYGKGRFKIPYEQLAPYINTPQVVPNESFIPSVNKLITEQKPNRVIPQVVVPAIPSTGNFQPKTSEENPLENIDSSEPIALASPQVIPDSQNEKSKTTNNVQDVLSSDDSISPAGNDKIFWRLFKGLTLLGLGLIYIFSGSKFYNFEDPLFGEIGGILRMFMPYMLLFGGFLTLADCFYEEKLKPFDSAIHVLNSIILCYYSFISVASGEYLGFVTMGGIAVMMVTHLLTGITHKGSFIDSFNKYTVLVTLFGGILLIISPDTYPLPYFTEIITEHKGLFALVWFGLVTIPALFFLSEGGKRLKSLITVYYLLLSMLRLVYATRLGMEEIWDISYMTYMMSIFGLFLLWWNNYKGALLQKKITGLSLSFVWVAVSILAGFLVVNQVRSGVKVQQDNLNISNLDKAKDNFDNIVATNQSVLIRNAGNPETANVILSGDEEAIITKAKDVFEKTEYAKRIAILNAGGDILAFYPREAMIQRANLSTRDYFKETVETKKGAISGVFTTVTGIKSFVMSEPVFKNNELSGMIVMSFDLPKLSLNIKEDFPENMIVHVVDKEGIYVFGSNLDKIGEKYDAAEFLHKNIGMGQNIDKYFNSYQRTSKNPEFTFNLYSPPPLLDSGLSYANILFTVFVVVNAAFSVFAGFLISTKKNEEKSGVRNTDMNYGQNNLNIREALQ